jgi:hypothetical protein
MANENTNNRNPFHDNMSLGDAHLQIAVRCAQCNEPVQTGTTHICKTKEPKNEQTTSNPE